MTSITILPSSSAPTSILSSPTLARGVGDERAAFECMPVDDFARAKLKRQVWQIEVDAFGWPRLLFGIWPTITKPNKTLIAAYQGGTFVQQHKMVGYCLSARKKTHQGQSAWYIESVGVRHDYRRRGIGRELVRCACAGNDMTWLHVRVSNTAAIRMYGSLGFVGRQVEMRFYKNNSEDALVMALEGQCKT